MTRIELTDSELIVHVQGWDRVWALTRRFTVPRQNVSAAEIGIGQKARSQIMRSLRLPGSLLPGVVAAGHYWRMGKPMGPWSFWAIRRGKRALTITLTNHRYNLLVVEVEDPAATVDAIQRWIETGTAKW